MTIFFEFKKRDISCKEQLIEFVNNMPEEACWYMLDYTLNEFNNTSSFNYFARLDGLEKRKILIRKYHEMLVSKFKEGAITKEKSNERIRN